MSFRTTSRKVRASKSLRILIPTFAACSAVAMVGAVMVHGRAGSAASTSSVGLDSQTRTPAHLVKAGARAAELGIRFRVSVPGKVVALRFYKSTRDNGAHTGSIWTGDGKRIANATFGGETSTGWQTVRFSDAVAVVPGRSYVASYHTDSGRYAQQRASLHEAMHRSASVEKIADVYRYGGSTFPSSQSHRMTFLVDPRFVPTRKAATTTAPVSSATPSSTPMTTPRPSATPSGRPGPTAKPSSSPTSENTTPTKSAVPPAGGKPGLTNTGVPTGTTLRTVTGDQVYRTAGQVVDGVDIHGYVTIAAPNVTIKNSIIRGGAAATSPKAVVSTGQGASGTTIEDSEIVPSNPGTWLDGVSASDATLLRVNIHGAVDGVKAFDNVTVQDSYIHDLSWYASQPNGAGQTHNDAVQTYEGNRNVTLRHNTLNPGKNGNSAYQVTQDMGNVATNLRVEDNWLDGGGCTLNFSHKGGPTPMTGIYVTNNRFGRGSAFNCPILISTQTLLSANSGNVWDDTDTAIPAPQQHD